MVTKIQGKLCKVDSACVRSVHVHVAALARLWHRCALGLASAWSPSKTPGKRTGTSRWCEKALLELYRHCRGDLGSQGLLSLEEILSRAELWPHPCHTDAILVSDPGRSKVNLARSEMFLSPTGRWLEVPLCFSAKSTAGNSLTASSCPSSPTRGMIRSPRVSSAA